MQQPPQMIPMMQVFPPTNITTEQIQKYLDENKKLILAILDNQNLGKLAECAQYQAQLQKNLMYLAAIADAQPQAPAMPPQMASHPTLQQGGYYMAQHPQAATAMAQQPGFFPPKMPLQFATPHQIPDSLQPLQHQGIQRQMGMRPMGSNNEIHPSQSHHMESSGGNKRGDSAEVGAAAADGGAGGSEAAQGSGKGEELK